MIARFLVIALILLCHWPSPASAFHRGGVASCNGCHTMHNSQDGVTQYHWNPNGNPYLLKYGNASDTCLMCHSSYGTFAQGTGYGPGGDFYWVTRSFSWTDPYDKRAMQESTADSHGHNIITSVFHIAADAKLTVAPGGKFLASRLSCTSCHDPHGNASFRMLYGTTIGPDYGDGSRYDFTADAPLAAGNGHATKVGDGGDETDAQHTVYKSGMSEWCANCHDLLHSENSTLFLHPTGIPLSEAADAYNAYVSSEDPTGGFPADSYRALVPFEAVNVDLSQVDPTQYTTGPEAGDRIMCLTCHRAHASPFPDIGRWDFSATFLNADSHPQITDGGAVAEDVDNRYYNFAFLDSQRSLCNKCHVKDLFDRPGP